jgi:hypothetical protein
LLVLARRGQAELPLALAAATWERVIPVAAVAPPMVEAPTVRDVVASAPPALAPPTRVTLDDVLKAVAALDAPPSGAAAADTYRRAVDRLHRSVAGLAAAGSVPPPVIAGLETVLSYHDAAALAWASDDTARAPERRLRRLPVNEAAGAPFFSDSEIAAAIDQFPFLRETVIRDPTPGPLAGESAGLWRPLAARTLLWQHARLEEDRLVAWVRKGTP